MSLTAAQTRALARVTAWARKGLDLDKAPADLDGPINWAIKSGYFQITSTRSGKIILEPLTGTRNNKARPAPRLLTGIEPKQRYKCANCGQPIFRARSRATGKVREIDAMPRALGVLHIDDLTKSLPYFLATPPGEIPATDDDLRPGYGYGIHTCQAATLFDPTPHIKEQEL